MPEAILLAGTSRDKVREAFFGEPEAASSPDHVLVLGDGVRVSVRARMIESDNNDRSGRRVHTHCQRRRGDDYANGRLGLPEVLLQNLAFGLIEV